MQQWNQIKKILLNNMAEKYRSMDPKEKQNLCSNNAEKYRSMEPNKNEALIHR